MTAPPPPPPPPDTVPKAPRAQQSAAGSARPSAADALPGAVLRPQRRATPSPVWLIPILAVLLAGWLGYRAWTLRGVVVSVQLVEGHGLKPGDDVRYRGITVGEIRQVEADSDLAGVVVTASLRSAADQLARAGSRFWVVRPQVGLEGVAGLETLVGPRYLGVLPGHGSRQRRFVGLTEPPVVDAIEPGDLEIVLGARQRGSLRRGAPVRYRQVRVGTVLSVGLTSDGGGVEARVHVEKAYTQLIRQRTRFWEVSGLHAQIGLGGLSVDFDSLETLLAGGVSLATPPDAGDVVRTGHRFVLEAQPQEAWLDWEPMALLGSALLPPGARMPSPLRATLGWKQGRWISRQRQRQGWLLQTSDGLLGPADLLRPGESADQETAILEVAGTVLPWEVEASWEEGGLALLDADVSEMPWPANRLRAAEAPEDCLAIGDPAAAPLPLAAARLTPQEGAWLVDPAVPVDESWHGACVLARRDGYLVGLLLVVEDEPVRVALLPEK